MLTTPLLVTSNLGNNGMMQIVARLIVFMLDSQIVDILIMRWCGCSALLYFLVTDIIDWSLPCIFRWLDWFDDSERISWNGLGKRQGKERLGFGRNKLVRDELEEVTDWSMKGYLRYPDTSDDGAGIGTDASRRVGSSCGSENGHWRHHIRWRKSKGETWTRKPRVLNLLARLTTPLPSLQSSNKSCLHLVYCGLIPWIGWEQRIQQTCWKGEKWARPCEGRARAENNIIVECIHEMSNCRKQQRIFIMDMRSRVFEAIVLHKSLGWARGGRAQILPRGVTMT